VTFGTFSPEGVLTPGAQGLECGGVAVPRIAELLRAVEPAARAFYLYDLEALDARTRRFGRAFAPIAPVMGFAIKSNALGAVLECVREAGLDAEAGSLGELELAGRAGFRTSRMVLNGNGRTPEEAQWAVRHRIHSVNADHVAELELLEREAAAQGGKLRVALRINPGVETPGHRYVATGHDEAKFGIAPGEALDAWQNRARWPHLHLDGIHVHVGSQLIDFGPMAAALDAVFAIARESEGRGAPLRLINIGGGFGIDYGGMLEFPLEDWARHLAARAEGSGFEWALEPGRWIVAPIGALISEVMWVKRRGEKRFIVLAAGMNDLIRPALYGARHRIVPVLPREGARSSATVVGPVCESADVFGDYELPEVEPGDLVAILDTGAYGAVMASNYNGRGRLAEVVVRDRRITRARAGETAEDLAAKWRDDDLG